jgi:hypothetical protein
MPLLGVIDKGRAQSMTEVLHRSSRGNAVAIVDGRRDAIRGHRRTHREMLCGPAARRGGHRDPAGIRRW